MCILYDVLVLFWICYGFLGLGFFQWYLLELKAQNFNGCFNCFDFMSAMMGEQS